MKEKLNAAFCEKTRKPGRYADGGNLYFLVKPDGRKSWVFRFVDPVTRKRQDMGLGRFGKNYVTLTKARDAAAEARDLLSEFKNPIEERRRKLRGAQRSHTARPTFGECALRYIESNEPEWRNEKHAAQWRSTLQTYAAPIWNTPVADIDQDAVLRCLEPCWTTKTVTMTRVRQRIESVLSWATVRHYRSGDNPARWKNHLDQLMPKPTKLNKVRHRPALPYNQLGQFMSDLRKVDTLAASALELQILTAARPGEIVNARWDEFDFRAKLWTVPAERMKANKEHEIPLSEQVVTLLRELPRMEGCLYLFPGLDAKKPMTTAAGMKLLRELRQGYTQHGFRSTFRDWAAEQTSFPRDVIEHALAHQLKDKAEASYYRSTALPKRKRLMKAWADYCDRVDASNNDNVTAIGNSA